MAGSAMQRHNAQLMAKLYPAFSRRATQVCILSAALERADPFGWVARNKTPNAELTGPWRP